jgi:predicted enzyme related to lactoylglutathione lyase
VGATCDRAAGLGATVLHPATDIEGAGCFAVLQDPQGAPFAIYTSESLSSDPPEPAGVGEFSWHELATSDYQAGYDFYAALFDWETKEDMDMGEGWMYRIYGEKESFPLGGMFTKPEEMPGPPMWLYYISVPSVDDAAEKVKALGGKVLNGPMDVPGGDKIAQCMDPQGAAFALHSSA